MQIKLSLQKTVEQNADVYFTRAKKAKAKAKKTREVMVRFAKKVRLQTKNKKSVVLPAKKEWYDKFRWFTSSEDMLVVCGRDATTNDILLKKHTSDDDIIVHTVQPGSPFCVVPKHAGQKTLHEAATFTVTFSKAWKQGLSTTDVFYVTRNQVSKHAESGEYIQKGAWMIRGKKNFIAVQIDLAIGTTTTRVMVGPLSAVKKHCTKFVALAQGKEKTSAVAKKIQKIIGGNLDDIIRILPSGLRIKKQ
jgi:predicted ribosome quality control (RQC) complex YloA/Tae2 family protein